MELVFFLLIRKKWKGEQKAKRVILYIALFLSHVIGGFFPQRHKLFEVSSHKQPDTHIAPTSFCISRQENDRLWNCGRFLWLTYQTSQVFVCTWISLGRKTSRHKELWRFTRKRWFRTIWTGSCCDPTVETIVGDSWKEMTVLLTSLKIPRRSGGLFTSHPWWYISTFFLCIIFVA